MGCPIEDDGGDELILGTARERWPRNNKRSWNGIWNCARCRELAEAQRLVWSALEAWPPAVVSANFDERLFRRIEIERQKCVVAAMVAGGSGRLRPAVPVGVACAALIAAFLLKESRAFERNLHRRRDQDRRLNKWSTHWMTWTC